MLTNNIVIVCIIVIVCRPFDFHIIAVYTEACIQSQFLAHAINVHSVLGQLMGQCRFKG